MITVALTKGRLFKDFIKYMEESGLNDYIGALTGETRSLYTVVAGVKFIFAKGPDVPTYVESGVADLGIVGSDIITEDAFNILNVSRLPFGDCHFSVAALPDRRYSAPSRPSIRMSHSNTSKAGKWTCRSCI